MSGNQKLFALLIDGDNIQPELAPQILDVVNKYGKPIIKKIYGDWSREQLQDWGAIVRQHDIEIEHSYHLSNGKNATDIALVIDAMDILHLRGDKLDGFCIVSSDSDFTHLAKRIKQDGLLILGVGRENSRILKETCDYFISTESLHSPNSKFGSEGTHQPAEEISDTDLLKLLIKAYKQAANNETLNGEDGWIPLPDIKRVMLELNPAYQPNTRTLAEKLQTLATAKPGIIEIYGEPDGKPVTHYVRVLEDREIDKFCRAYDYAAEELKLKDKDGWVTLAAIGDTLPKLYPDYQRYVYRGVKYNQLKKVVEKMVEDYPEIIELKDAPDRMCIMR